MSNGWLDELPWANDQMKRDHNVGGGSKRRSKPNNAIGGSSSMWSSAPNLNFQMDSNQDDNDPFLSFDEPDFSKSAANLGYDFNAELDEDDIGFDAPRTKATVDLPVSPRVKVKASHLSNMKQKEKEIKNLFSQWKSTTKHVGGNCAFPDLSPTSPTKSPTRTTRKIKKKELMKLQTCPPSFDGDGGSPANSKSPTKRKKKVAVKLKACDLNLSKSKQEEIEQMFWKWKEQVKDPAAVDPKQQLAAADDQRWSEPSRAVSSNRPKPASRQESISAHETNSTDEKEKVLIKPLRASSREQAHPLRTRSRSSGRPEQQQRERKHRSRSRDSHDDDDNDRIQRERSKSRGPDEARRERSRSSDVRRRTKSRSRSKSTERDDDVLRSKSRSRSRSKSIERDEDVTRSKSRSRSKSTERSEDVSPEAAPRRRSKSTSRRPSYIRRARSNESMESTVSATRSGRKPSPSPSDELEAMATHSPFPL